MTLFTCFEHQAIFPEKDIPQPCFDWLVAQEFLAFQLATQNGKLCLKARQYVGVIATPFGTQIEILPKITNTKDISATRQCLIKLLNTNYLNQAKTQQNQAQQSEVTNQPVHVWLIQKFLSQCERILASGVTSHYQNQQENEAYLRGKLNVADNIRQNQARLRQHQFAQTADSRKNDSPENRVLMHALYFLVNANLYQQVSCQSIYQRLSDATGLRLASMADVLSYQQNQFGLDVQACQRKRLLPPYQTALPIAQMILSATSNGSGIGQTQGVSLLFNMQSLFEKMVASALENTLLENETLSIQHTGKAVLQADDGQAMFHLRPDIVVMDKVSQQAVKVVDAKWKLIDQKNINSSINQADIYQMVAYATSYFSQCESSESVGELWLVYPMTQEFNKPMTYSFKYLNSTHLKILPFDLELGLRVDGISYECQTDSMNEE